MLSVCISFLLLFSYPLIGLVLWDRRILIIIIINNNNNNNYAQVFQFVSNALNDDVFQ
jgi:hypothetical protein